MAKKLPESKATLPRTAKRKAASAPVAIVVSRYNRTVTDALLAGALTEARAANVPTEVFQAAGAFEIIGICAAAAATGRFAGILALGCIIKGETKHDDYLAHAVTTALGNLAAAGGVRGPAVALGVLTVNTNQQAIDRSGGKQGNKGAEAMLALLDSMAVCHAIRTGARPGPIAGSLAGSRSPDKLTRN